ncbi:MAG: hypothetical protein QXY76_06880 [Nitrososphaeria archaeon]
MSIGPVDPKDLFTLMLDVREFSFLWYKARQSYYKGERFTKEEKDRLKELFEHIANEIGILPFKGRLLKRIIVRRPKLLPKFTKIPVVTDIFLQLLIEYLNYKCDHAVWDDISKDPENRLKAYLDRNQSRLHAANGHIFEIIVRKWLSEIINSHWRNVQRVQFPAFPGKEVHGIEIDAFSMIRENDTLILSLAEIQWSLKDEHVIYPYPGGKYSLIEEVGMKLNISIEYINKYFNPKKIIVKEVGLIGAKKIHSSHKNHILQKLRNTINKSSIKVEKYFVYDIEDILNSVKVLPNDNALRKTIDVIVKLQNV